MIIQQHPFIHDDGTEDEGLVLTTTDDKTKALFQVETGAIYESALDVWPLLYHYEEVDRPEDWDKDEPEDE